MFVKSKIKLSGYRALHTKYIYYFFFKPLGKRGPISKNQYFFPKIQLFPTYNQLSHLPFLISTIFPTAICRYHEDNCGLFSCLWFVCKCEYHKKIVFSIICSNFCDMSVIFVYLLNFSINLPKVNISAGKPWITYHTHI